MSKLEGDIMQIPMEVIDTITQFCLGCQTISLKPQDKGFLIEYRHSTDTKEKKLYTFKNEYGWILDRKWIKDARPLYLDK